jgi:hypothetical protein
MIAFNTIFFAKAEGGKGEDIPKGALHLVKGAPVGCRADHCHSDKILYP